MRSSLLDGSPIQAGIHIQYANRREQLQAKAHSSKIPRNGRPDLLCPWFYMFSLSADTTSPQSLISNFHINGRHIIGRYSYPTEYSFKYSLSSKTTSALMISCLQFFSSRASSYFSFLFCSLFLTTLILPLIIHIGTFPFVTMSLACSVIYSWTQYHVLHRVYLSST